MPVNVKMKHTGRALVSVLAGNEATSPARTETQYQGRQKTKANSKKKKFRRFIAGGRGPKRLRNERSFTADYRIRTFEDGLEVWIVPGPSPQNALLERAEGRVYFLVSSLEDGGHVPLRNHFCGSAGNQGEKPGIFSSDRP